MNIYLYKYKNITNIKYYNLWNDTQIFFFL